jgi:MFS family permease
VARAENRLQTSFWPRVEPAQRATCLRALALVSAFGVVQTACFLYASELAQTTYGWDGRFTLIVVLAGVFGVLGYFLGGRVSDRVGRKPIVAAAILLASAGTMLIFTEVEGLFIPGFFLATAGAASFMAVTLTYLAELFPTEIRATLISVVLSCQVAAGSLGLVIVGALASVVKPSSVLLLAGGALVGSLVLLRGLPEVGGCDILHAAQGHAAPAQPQRAVPALQPA